MRQTLHLLAAAGVAEIELFGAQQQALQGWRGLCQGGQLGALAAAQAALKTLQQFRRGAQPVATDQRCNWQVGGDSVSGGHSCPPRD